MDWDSSCDSRGIRLMDWDKLSVPKKFGGLGVRNIYAFNLAMLGKQAWKFIDKPHALVAQVFRARYFPNGDFLTATVGHNPSYAWKSIWSSRGLVREGLRWRIGDGSQVPVWVAPWLRNGHIMQCPPQFTIQQSQIRVKDLWQPHLKEWNVDLIRNCFPSDIAKVILQTPLFDSVTSDKLIWNQCDNGEYTVKSAYRMAMTQLVDATHLYVTGDWHFIWQLNVPPRVKMFLWRASRKCLPTRDQLQRRGMQCPNQCVLCDNHDEDNVHIFLDCPAVKPCWNLQHLSADIDQSKQPGAAFSDTCFRLFTNWDQQNRAKFAMTLWSIWRMRNDKLWENAITDPRQVVARANQFWTDWNLARMIPGQTQGHSHASQDIEGWKPPPVDHLKVNIDAGFSRVECRTAFGICCRDHRGEFQAAMMDNISFCLKPAEGEAAALLKALQWAIEQDMDHVIFEVDSQVVAHSINHHRIDTSEFGMLIKDCRETLSFFPNFSVSCVRRQANNVAHTLAREAVFIASRQDFYHVPLCIEALLLNEM